MAELKIIGVRRIEALLTVLDAQEKKGVANIDIPLYSEIEKMVDAEFIITDKRAKADLLKTQLQDVLSEIETVTGESREVSIRYNRTRTTDHKRRYDDLCVELRDKPIAELKRTYAEKRTQLWMCETLEEAKAIVGVA